MTFPTELERLKHAGWPAHASAEVLRNHAPAILELVRAAENVRDVKGRYHTEQATLRLFDALAKLNGGKG